jgi:dTDP-4-dehydrorhamnose 3,5-epimerase
MEIVGTGFDGLFVIKHSVFGDERGYFLESFSQKNFKSKGIDASFVQDNISKSSKKVLRGLHFQLPPFDQGKLVRVITGAVLDVVVDIRKSSPNYGQHFSIELSEENKFSLWVPSGFAHGFSTLADETIFSYKCTNYYSKPHEQTIMWNDKDLAIDWKTMDPILSQKDLEGMPFNLFSSPF